MLDSLVRVSRRVGWRADRFATDPKCPVHPSQSPSALREHCKQSTQFDRTARAEGRQARQFLGLPTSLLRNVYNTTSEELATFRLELLTASKPVVALYPGKVHTPVAAEPRAGLYGSKIPQSAARRQAEFPRADFADPPVCL